MKKNKKDKKKYFCKNLNKATKRHEELTGNIDEFNLDTLKGVMITTDKNKEKNCVRDSYNILNDAVEHLYPELLDKLRMVNQETAKKEEKVSELDTNESKPIKLQKAEGGEKIVTKSENVADMLESELEVIRKSKVRLFYNFETNCKGVIFIKVDKNVKNELDIKRVVNYISDSIKEKKEQVSKNIARFVPIELAFKAKLENFKTYVPEVLDKYFKSNEHEVKKSWKLEFKSRNNNAIKKQEYLDFLLNYIDNNKFYVDYKTPELTVLVEISNDLLCFSVLEKYNANKGYNLLTLSKSDEELKSEREKLINKQKLREEEKSKEKSNEENAEISKESLNAGKNEVLSDEEQEINII